MNPYNRINKFVCNFIFNPWRTVMKSTLFILSLLLSSCDAVVLNAAPSPSPATPQNSVVSRKTANPTREEVEALVARSKIKGAPVPPAPQPSLMNPTPTPGPSSPMKTNVTCQSETTIENGRQVTSISFPLGPQNCTFEFSRPASAPVTSSSARPSISSIAEPNKNPLKTIQGSQITFDYQAGEASVRFIITNVNYKNQPGRYCPSQGFDMVLETRNGNTRDTVDYFSLAPYLDTYLPLGAFHSRSPLERSATVLYKGLPEGFLMKLGVAPVRGKNNEILFKTPVVGTANASLKGEIVTLEAPLTVNYEDCASAMLAKQGKAQNTLQVDGVVSVIGVE